MAIVLWDKQRPINGISAEEYLKNNPQSTNDDLVLIIDDITNKVIRIESIQVLASNEKIDTTGKTPIQIFEEYELIQENKKTQAQQEKKDIEELKIQLQTIQEAIDFIIMGGM